MLDQPIREALATGHTIDITTTGRKTGQPRRKEIVFHNLDGKLYISGIARPKKRDWLANLEANPALTFHLKQTVTADLPATARPITDPAERRQVLEKIARVWGREGEIEEMVKLSPLVEVTIDNV